MSKTFSCQELGGVCEEKFSGDSLSDIMQKAMPHMMSDDAHKTHMMTLAETLGENKEAWMGRMQKEFDERAEN